MLGEPWRAVLECVIPFLVYSLIMKDSILCFNRKALPTRYINLYLEKAIFTDSSSLFPKVGTDAGAYKRWDLGACSCGTVTCSASPLP